MEHNKEPHSVRLEDLEKHYRTNLKLGLTHEEAKTRYAEVGRNSLPEKKQRGLLFNFLLQFKSPLVYLLFIAAALMAVMGRASDPIVILAVVVVNAIMGLVQEGRAEKSLSALRKLAQLDVRVLRDGEEREIVASELVPGDVIHLAAGDAVPADARIIEEARLQVIESSMTGESQAVYKSVELLDPKTALTDRKNMLYSGTHVTAGRCLALVTATGVHTELGQIAKAAESNVSAKTPIEKRIASFSHRLSIIAIVVFFLLLGIGFLRELPISDVFMAAISQVVSLIPEGLPAAIAIALAVGVQRMAAQGAIVRRLAAVETLGSTTVICTDKTGTLTRGEMVVSEVFLPGQPMILVEGIGYAPEGRFLQAESPIDPHDNNALLILLEVAVLCNDAKLQKEGNSWCVIGDPTEGALITLVRKAELDDLTISQQFPRLGEIPFDSRVKMMVTAHEGVVMIKGAIEAVLELCHAALINDEEQELSEKLRKDIEHEAELSALQGKRVLAFARVEGGLKNEDFAQLKGRALFLGFVAEIDPPREEAALAVALCKQAGICPMMVTGDHLLTAQAIGKQLGILKKEKQAIDGKQLDEMSDEELAKNIRNYTVFARLHPAQKLRIIGALQTKGEVVAMTGDGVNDAPALAKADIGVAMGITGTDVAKEAAKMVITDDNFYTLVKAVEQGRLVYYNIKKVILYLLTTNCAAALVMLVAVALGFPLPMDAVQILWINVVIEGTVTINLVLDPLEGDEMHRPPVRKDDQILSGGAFLRLLYLTPTIAILLLAYFILQSERGEPLVLLQTQTFTLLAFCAWFKVLSARSENRSCLNLSILKNRYLTFGLALSVLLQAAVIYIPQLNEVFHTTPLKIGQVFVLLCIGSIVMWVEELRKWIFRKRS